MISDIAYSRKHQCFYSVQKNKWLCPKCSDINCEFCRNRPDSPIDKKKTRKKSVK